MPELPEVETSRRTAEAHVVGRRIRAVHADDERLLRNTTVQGLGRAVTGARITTTGRTGKWITLSTDAISDLVVHFGMTGSLRWRADGRDGPGEYDHVRMDFDDGVLALHMPRKFGGIWLARSTDERDEITGELGRDALGLDAQELRDAIGDSSATLKSALMDQGRVAGIGNLLSDEVCWQARIHPAQTVDTLDEPAFGGLADALARALDVGLDMGHVPTAEGFLLEARSDDDARCPRCDAPLASDTIAGRTSYWCPRDQPEPR